MSVTTPNKEIAKPTHRPSRPWLKISIVLLIIVAVVVMVVVFSNKKRPSDTSFSAYNYSTLVDSQVQGSRTSMEFKRPKQFIQSSDNSSILQSTYTQNGRDNQGNPAVIGDISGYAPHYIISENPSVDLSAVRNSFNSASDYQNYAKQVFITSFLSDQMKASYYDGINSSNTLINLGQPKSITTNNLPTDTWLFPFTATNTSKPNLKVQGEIVFHLGKNTAVYNGYDYLMLSTVDASWQPNQSTWQKIVDSLQITDK